MVKKTPTIYLGRTLASDMGNPHELSQEQRNAIGVEIELEGQNLITRKAAINENWINHQDGSLRCKGPDDQATEYVFRRPLEKPKAKKALVDMFEHLNSDNVKVYPSYRTSIHVHVNCLLDPMRVVLNFITLAIIFDELFVSQNGATRIGNNFCLRTRDAEGQIDAVVSSLENYGNLLSVHNQYRYSSVNVASLVKFGTLEFRSLECTTDFERVWDWVLVLLKLKDAAADYDNPRDILAKLSRKGPMGFLLHTLGDHAMKYYMVPDAARMLRDGMWLAQDLAFCSDWKAAGDMPEAPKPIRKSRKSAFDIEGMPPQLHQYIMAGGAQGWVNQAPQHAPQPPLPDELMVPDFDDED